MSNLGQSIPDKADTHQHSAALTCVSVTTQGPLAIDCLHLKLQTAPLPASNVGSDSALPDPAAQSLAYLDWGGLRVYKLAGYSASARPRVPVPAKHFTHITSVSL